jgi:two-component system cell cycle response regulator CpdR
MARIILAEDDSAMRHFLATALLRAGHEVSSHPDGQSALGAIDASHDLLITDVVMPGMDGVELARRTREQFPGMRIMFITGFAAVVMGDGRRTAVPGATVISKPFHLRRLVDEVQRLLAA